MAIDLIEDKNIVLATFGDMLKVKGTCSNLAERKSCNNVITVYSPEDAVTLAMKNQDKIVVFLAVGFETTVPIIAAVIKDVFENGPDNLFFLTALKRMEPVLRMILGDDRKRIDGLICPGHVAAVLGSDAFRFVTDEFHIPSVICGFEAEDIKKGIFDLIDQIEGRKSVAFSNLYERCVSPKGNIKAQQFINEVFQISNGNWRGIGKVLGSALVLNDKYKKLDAKNKFGINEKALTTPTPCRCSEIILGIKVPYECKQFGVNCTPENPLGPCMISLEGACSAHYKYGRFPDWQIK
jgi:hydrogenase expression/formation protein HypD